MVCLALSRLLKAGGLALVLMAFASVVSWVLIFGENFYLLFKLFLVLHPVFLDFPLKQQQLISFLLNFLHFHLVQSSIALRFLSFLINQPLQFIYLCLFLFFQLDGPVPYIFFFLDDLFDTINLLLLRLCTDSPFLFSQLIFADVSIKHLNLSTVFPFASLRDCLRSLLSTFPYVSLAGLPSSLDCSIDSPSDFLLRVLCEWQGRCILIGDDERLEVELVDVVLRCLLVLCKTEHN